MTQRLVLHIIDTVLDRQTPELILVVEDQQKSGNEAVRGREVALQHDTQSLHQLRLVEHSRDAMPRKNLVDEAGFRLDRDETLPQEVAILRLAENTPQRLPGSLFSNVSRLRHREATSQNVRSLTSFQDFLQSLSRRPLRAVQSELL